MTTLISSNNNGNLYKLKHPYNLTIEDTTTPFGTKQSYNKFEICWYIKDINKQKYVNMCVFDLKENILPKINMKNASVISKMSRKDNYPPIIQTSIESIKNSSECIEHEPGVVVSFYDIRPKTQATVDLECAYISTTSDKVNMIWTIKKIYNIHYNI
jgi:hypothetical protein